MRKQALHTLCALCLAAALCLCATVPALAAPVTAPGGTITNTTAAEEVKALFGGAATVTEDTAAKTGRITLTENVTIGNIGEISGGVAFADTVRAWTLDLAGFTLTGQAAATSAAVVRQTDGTLTIEDSGNIGRIVMDPAGKESSYAVCLDSATAFTLAGGELTGGEWGLGINETNATVSGGRLHGTRYGLVALNSGDNHLTISGGEFSAAATCFIHWNSDAPRPATITGGVFLAPADGNSLSTSNDHSLSDFIPAGHVAQGYGGAAAPNLSGETCATSFSVSTITGGTIKGDTTAAAIVRMLGGKATVQDNVITLTDHVALVDHPLEFDGSDGAVVYRLDLNGHTLSRVTTGGHTRMNITVWLKFGAELAVCDSSSRGAIHNDNNGFAVQAQRSARLIAEGGDFVGGASASIALLSAAELVIHGGSFDPGPSTNSDAGAKVTLDAWTEVLLGGLMINNSAGSTTPNTLAVAPGQQWWSPYAGSGSYAPLSTDSSTWKGDAPFFDNKGTIRIPVYIRSAEQFPRLQAGETYYFDLSDQTLPGTLNTALPEKSLHYTPFTFAGKVNAYTLDSSSSGDKDAADNANPYVHSLFIADHNLTATVSWNELNTAGLIFGKKYTANGVAYTLRAPSVGSYSNSIDNDTCRGIPNTNEWDAILNKDSSYIQNWSDLLSWGQDTYKFGPSYRALRGNTYSGYLWTEFDSGKSNEDYLCYRPVLEIPATVATNGLKPVSLDLAGGKLGEATGSIKLAVKVDAAYQAPAAEGLTPPENFIAADMQWQDGDGNTYAPGADVPATVTTLTAVWQAAPPKATVYPIIEGANSAWQPGDEALSIKSVGDYDLLRNVYLDNELLATENYTATKGSTVITLKPEFLATLAAGVHTLRINFYGGYSTTTFTIGEAPPTPWQNPFKDVSEGNWFYADVMYVAEKGLMQGTDGDEFSPYDVTSRAMLVTILWRMEGEPIANYAMTFKDVPAGKWYSEAVRWAAAEKIVEGYSTTAFGPEDEISREQLATILYRYAAYKKYDVSARADLTKFKDAATVGKFAAEAMSWAVANELIQGKSNGLLDPQGEARRGQTAAVLHRFCENIAQ